MGTRLYKCKITENIITMPSGSELFNALNGSDWLQELKYWLMDSKGIETFMDFRKSFKSYVEKLGQDEVLDRISDNFFLSKKHYKRISSLLHSNLAKEVKADDFYYLEGFYCGNNLLSELLPKYFNKAPLRHITIDVVTVNEDAGFPNPMIDKDFCIRLLAEADGGMNSCLYRQFGDSFYEVNFGGQGESVYSIIAGVKRVETIDMEVEKQEFWDKYTDKWWYSLKNLDVFRAESSNKPYQVITYEVYIHPSWLSETLRTEPFDSTAFAVIY